MTREEIITRLEGMKGNGYKEQEQAIDEAIEIIKAQPCDAVSREAVIKAMYDLCDTGEMLKENIWRDNPHIDAIIDTIENLPPVTPASRWIPVTERLPQSEDKVLLFYESHYCHYVGSKPVHKGINYFTTIAFYDQENKEWYEDTEWSRNGDVISFSLAWMPLPKPWKGESV